MKKEYLLSRGEETHTKKSARVPKVEEPYYLCHHILSDRCQKEAKQERQRQKVPPSTTQEKVRKIPQKLHEISRDRKVWPN
jgi:hypothetical protein